MAAIEVRQVSKRFGALQALAGIDLEIDEGEFFGLLGPNGAGKTTLISILAGLARANTGSVRIMGHDVALDYRGARRALGLAHPFQSQRDCRRVDFGDGRKIDRVGALTEMFLGLQDQSGHRVERYGALEHQHLAFASNHPGHTDNFVCRIVDCPARKIRKGAPSPLFNFPEPDEPESNGLPSIDATALWISDRCNCATVRNPETYTKPNSSPESSTVNSYVTKVSGLPLSGAAILRDQHLDQAVDSRFPHLRREVLAIVGDQGHAVDLDVVDFPS